VDVVRESGDWSAFEPAEVAIDAAVAALSRHPCFAGQGSAEACVALCDDAAVKSLNASYRHKDKATNVLSFPAPPMASLPAGESRMLGDVVLAAETIRREAYDLGLAPQHHLQHLVVHGLLHLLGYDHETEEEAVAMERVEIEILASMNIANPYLEPAGGEAAHG